ncbi:MAG: SpoIIE family protein phosphatase [Prevotella sp.]|nr:SpoIIE family protein phosphatase [Prevotella sp.]
MVELVDSFAQAGEISELNANRWRGTAYYRQGQYRSAEYYYKKAVTGTIVNESDHQSYIKAARRLSELLLIKGDYEGALKVAMPAVQQLEKMGIGSDIDYAILLNNIGCCQLNLGRVEEANASFLNARGHYANRWENDSTGRGLQEAVIGTVYTSQAYINTKRFEKSLYWIDRTEMLLDKYRLKSDARQEYFDEYQGRIEIMRAVARQGLGETEEAAKAYKAFLQTDYSKTSTGRIESNEYLLDANRFAEAADNYRYLNQMLKEHGMVLSLDNIQLYLLPKIRANIGAHRRDSVLALVPYLCNRVDSAITISKEDDAAELATIYDTQQKDAQIAKQQADMDRQRLVGTLTALVFLVIFFGIYTFNRRRHLRNLSDAHEKLIKAYDQLEETTTAKERIESELRIARDIQMSMVPSIFPNRTGLDIFAAMTPAKEVGGDLYSYLMLGENLYFCVGDVSGKGVPASLFMAQAIRLFRTLAGQGMAPAEIATRMNAALVEDNEQGMFVTMFIGMVNLVTGHLDFCNAGHNPPVLNGEFLTMETNAPFGLWPDLEFAGESIDCIKGQPLFIYSDGLSEAENKKQVQFGDDRLLEILRSQKFSSARELIDYITGEVERHRNGALPNDDLTMLALRVD